MKKKLSPTPFLVAVGLGLGFFFLQKLERSISNFAFALGSGFLIVGLIRLLSNMKMFASFSWGTRFFKRIFRGTARSGREETEDYAAYRESLGGHTDVPYLIGLSVALILVSLVFARL